MKEVKNRMVTPEILQKRAEAVPASIPARKPPCPFCGNRVSRVNNTNGVYRHRVCGGCGRSFATVETVKQ